MVEHMATYRFSEELFRLCITIEDRYFVCDEYDWVIIFTAKDTVTAKKFCTLITKKYPGTIEKMKTAQVLKTIRSKQIINPDNINLRELF
jgi:hypothetical protein